MTITNKRIIRQVNRLARVERITGVTLGRQITFHIDGLMNTWTKKDGQFIFRDYVRMGYSKYFWKTSKIWIKQFIYLCRGCILDIRLFIYSWRTK